MISFEEIYNSYFSDVYRFILKLSNDQYVAEEITQETFYKALKNIDNFKGNSHIKVWLCQIAKNTYFTKYNQKNKANEYNYDEDDSSNSIEKSLIDKESALSVHKALHSLEEPYKEVFTLRVFGELTFKQIGDIFNKTESWARVVYHRSRIKLKDTMKEVI